MAYNNTYDYIFTGAGASAGLVLLEMHRNDMLRDKKILLIDPESKTSNDKTYCFWAESTEEVVTELRDLIEYRWTKTGNSPKEIQSLLPLQYCQISSISLYRAVEALAVYYKFDRHLGTASDISSADNDLYVTSGQMRFRASLVFDSRPPRFLGPASGQSHLWQSFSGWRIHLTDTVFDTSVFRMMDFNIPQDGNTQFVYLLPYSDQEALVEVTRFGREPITQEEAEQHLDKYIQVEFGAYKILATETGCIPMSNTGIEGHVSAGVIPLGARNYHIKPSTGYAFKTMFYQAKQIVGTIKENSKNPHPEFTRHIAEKHTKTTPPANRFAFFDALLLWILAHKPHWGKPIFETLFRKIEVRRILQFLEEKSNVWQEIKIFARLPWPPFLTALRVLMYSTPWFRPVCITLVTSMLWLMGTDTFLQNISASALLVSGLLLVGIPHGAVDHLLDSGKWHIRKTPLYISGYILQGALLGGLWYVSPVLGLLIFITFSSWHFGQADGKLWHFSSPLSFLWGASVLMYLLGTHTAETNTILNVISGVQIDASLPVWSMAPWALYALYRQKFALLWTAIWLSIASYLPLIYAFGLYFIGQHSITGWGHIKSHLQESHSGIWLKSLPFHMGAWGILLLFYFFWPEGNISLENVSGWGPFFVFIACISFPHALAMHKLYTKHFR